MSAAKAATTAPAKAKVGQSTDRVLTCFRIGDPDGMFPIYDSEGARLYPGRWNTSASPIIYTSEHYSAAMLEKLVHNNAILPANQHFVRIIMILTNSFSVFSIFPKAMRFSHF